MSSSVNVSISDEYVSKITTISISQTFETPLVEGNTMRYDIVVPEKNDCIPESLLQATTIGKQRIAIRPGRLQMLLDVEKKMKLSEDMKRRKLEKLHEKEKSDATAVNERMRRYVEAHRDEINARRRERRAASNKAPAASNIVIFKRVCKSDIPPPISDSIMTQQTKAMLLSKTEATKEGLISFS